MLECFVCVCVCAPKRVSAARPHTALHPEVGSWVSLLCVPLYSASSSYPNKHFNVVRPTSAAKIVQGMGPCQVQCVLDGIVERPLV